MFRDSRGVVHTVSSADPLADLPPAAARALQEALLPLPPPGGTVDVGGVLEQAEAVRDLLGRWQDAFFEALPDEVDVVEEARWAAEAGLSLAEVEADCGADSDDDVDVDIDVDVDVDGQPGAGRGAGSGPGPDLLDEPDILDGPDVLDDLELLLHRGAPGFDPDDPRAVLPEPLVTALERELLLLPVRVRLEALVAADDLVQEWTELVADREKLLGHLVLAHDLLPGRRERGHEALAARHAALHAAGGPAHGRRGVVDAESS